MNTAIRSAALAVRLPFLIVGFFLLAPYALVGGILVTLFCFVIILVSWLTELPGYVFRAPAKGDAATRIKQSIALDVAEWKRNYQEGYGHFRKQITGLYGWYITGS